MCVMWHTSSIWCAIVFGFRNSIYCIKFTFRKHLFWQSFVCVHVPCVLASLKVDKLMSATDHVSLLSSLPPRGEPFKLCVGSYCWHIKRSCLCCFYLLNSYLLLRMLICQWRWKYRLASFSFRDMFHLKCLEVYSWQRVGAWYCFSTAQFEREEMMLYDQKEGGGKQDNENWAALKQSHIIIHDKADYVTFLVHRVNWGTTLQ